MDRSGRWVALGRARRAFASARHRGEPARRRRRSAPMIARVARRLLWAVFIVWAVSSLAFVVNNVVPGDPALMVAGPQARPADVARIRVELGLDRPLVVQYGAFMRRLLHFGAWSFDPKL